jgi:hypothetical protein
LIIFRIEELLRPGILKTSDSKNHQFWVFQGLQKIAGFLERIDLDQMVGTLLIFVVAWVAQSVRRGSNM